MTLGNELPSLVIRRLTSFYEVENAGLFGATPNEARRGREGTPQALAGRGPDLKGQEPRLRPSRGLWGDRPGHRPYKGLKAGTAFPRTLRSERARGESAGKLLREARSAHRRSRSGGSAAIGGQSPPSPNPIFRGIAIRGKGVNGFCKHDVDRNAP